VSRLDTKGKVVLAIVTGTWRPNCHDEAQFLVQLDKKYRDKGLAIVALDFEEPEQQGNLERERAFVKHYGVQYTYLIAGAPAQMWEKVPQAVNLNSWPTTIFVGRDGLVKGIHTGFASPASGEYNNQLKEEFTAKIEKLLAEKPAPANTTAAAPVAVLLVFGLVPDLAQSTEPDVIVTASPAYAPLAALRGEERFPNGARLLLVHQGKPEPLAPGFTATADADVSFDAKTVLFSGKRGAGDPWQVWELTLADRSVRKVIEGAGDRQTGRGRGRRAAAAHLSARQRDSSGCLAGRTHSV
jgi:thiol-disulfide isomerase/thioredoxin